MAVYLSPVFGAGAQLFTSTGLVLAGGTVNTYLTITTSMQNTQLVYDPTFSWATL
jgi:hypothetical protein